MKQHKNTIIKIVAYSILFTIGSRLFPTQKIEFFLLTTAFVAVTAAFRD